MTKRYYESYILDVEQLYSHIDWIHEVLRYMENEDFSYDRFLYYLDHAGWCPDCESVNDGEGHEFYGGRQLINEGGDYECSYCYDKKEE